MTNSSAKDGCKLEHGDIAGVAVSAINVIVIQIGKSQSFEYKL